MSKPQCKPGDLAIIIKAQNFENIGKIVKVVEVAVEGMTFKAECGQIMEYRKLLPGLSWVVDSQGSALTAESLAGQKFKTRRRIFTDAYLLPIRDEPKKKKTERKKELTT